MFQPAFGARSTRKLVERTKSWLKYTTVNQTPVFSPCTWLNDFCLCFQTAKIILDDYFGEHKLSSGDSVPERDEQVQKVPEKSPPGN